MSDHPRERWFLLRRKMDWAALVSIFTILGIVWTSISWGAVIVSKHKSWMIKVDECLRGKAQADHDHEELQNLKTSMADLKAGVDDMKDDVKWMRRHWR